MPVSTQWDIVRNAAERIVPAYQELICQAAQGEVLYNDDTSMKILSLMQQDSRFDEEYSRSNRNLYVRNCVDA